MKASSIHITAYRFVLLLLAGAVLAGPAPGETAPTAKYVFLFIGDGMGSAQRQLAEAVYQARSADSDEPPKLAMNRLDVTGQTRTASANSLVTDSAAAGTAIACGVKTNNGMIGQDPAGVAHASLAELARQKGMKVGVLSSVAIDHATPASFYAHQPSRNQYWAIAMQLPKSRFDFFGGGSLIGAIPRARRDREDPFDAITAAGYAVVRSPDPYGKVPPDQPVYYVYPDCDGSAAMPLAIDRGRGEGDLADLTARAIERLDGPAGFFIMVEGGRIDWAGHDNDTPANVADVLEFDAAVAEALAFATHHPQETLIIVTADHETGGLKLNPPLHPHVLDTIGMSAGRLKALVARLVEAKTPVDKAVRTLTAQYGLVDLTPAERVELAGAYAILLEGKKPGAARQAQYGKHDPVTGTCLALVNRRLGVVWTSTSHTAQTVPTTASGPGADRLSGTHDNTDLFTVIRSLFPSADQTQPQSACALAGD
jgi:alkaline phosphatase